MCSKKHNPKRTLLLILIFFILNSTFYIAQATVRYVSHSGSNTPPYTSWATAADSIMSAINISVFGDTIYVANGVYKERIDMIPGLNLRGAGMDSCVIDTREFQYSSGFYSVRVTDSCYFAGFQIITYDDTHGFGIYILDWNIELVSAVVEYNKIIEAFRGINITTSSLGFDSDYKLVRMNVITNVQDGIASAQTAPIITENIINPHDDGLVSQIISAPTYINNTIVCEPCFTGYTDFGLVSKLKNNIFYRISGGNYGLSTYGDTVVNNIVYGAWGDGISGASSVIKNTHIEKAVNGLDYDVGGGSPPVFQYNNLWNNQNNFQDFTPDSTNIYRDPMFVNEDSLDFHLQMYSPLIDAGDPNILDKDGSRSDIGLFGGPYGEVYTYRDLAPKPPRNLTAEVDSNIITLRWDKNTEADFNHYNLYRDTIANFVIDTTKLIASLQDTFYLHLIPAGIESLYFKLTGVDNQGNESNPSEELAIIITSVNEYPQIVSSYQLYQNFPNPFNPSTKISYKLKERGYVKLYVYDVKGELVSTLVNQFQDAGYYEVEFLAKNRSRESEVSNRIASGIYIYQIHVIGENNIPVYSDIKKMVYIK
ncbi:MAG: hypothetical protein DRQ13_01930 [Ignavibacteriae bacterium]|nr:MAG: hypothetical protein DRQ13_01930 [Ignavibacteriota bacterium]